MKLDNDIQINLFHFHTFNGFCNLLGTHFIHNLFFLQEFYYYFKYYRHYYYLVVLFYYKFLVFLRLFLSF